MDTATLSSKYQLVLPRGARERLKVRPGTKFTMLSKGDVIFLIPQWPMKHYRGLAKGTRDAGLREKEDRL
jgi:bifunctional DNA-binding transcriptional regulator/antitoxin component of YhaV-PrlF toxin-antitoxin module